MTNTHDLHIEDEIARLFDFTCNDFSKKTLVDILTQPASSIEEMLYRQEILKGFIANNKVLKFYFYPQLDLQEAYNFIGSLFGDYESRAGLKLQLLFSEKERHQKRGKFVQLILLLDKLYHRYFKKLDLNSFPEAYQKDLAILEDFFSVFKLKYYELIVREQGLKVRHIIELTDIITEKLNQEKVSQFWQTYFLYEAYLSASLGIVKHHFNFPVFSATNFTLQDFYHPLLKKPVKNSFTATSNIVILTGPNMSGKSTFLKAVSLCVYLARIGFAVPATYAQIPFFDSVSVAINLNDDIVNGYSHFMTEVINLKTLVKLAATNKKCFAVFDELFRGTNIEDAVEISTTTIKGLRKFQNSIFFISTHLHQLKEIAEVKTGSITTYYLDCELKEDIPYFTYILRPGWSDLKVGRLLFDKEGLNELLL